MMMMYVKIFFVDLYLLLSSLTLKFDGKNPGSFQYDLLITQHEFTFFAHPVVLHLNEDICGQ